MMERMTQRDVNAVMEEDAGIQHSGIIDQRDRVLKLLIVHFTATVCLSVKESRCVSKH